MVGSTAGGGGGGGDALVTREDLRGEASLEEVAGVEGSVERPEGLGTVGPGYEAGHTGGAEVRGLAGIRFQKKPLLKRRRDSSEGWEAGEPPVTSECAEGLHGASSKSSTTEIAFDRHHLHRPCSPPPRLPLHSHPSAHSQARSLVSTQQHLPAAEHLLPPLPKTGFGCRHGAWDRFCKPQSRLPL